MEVLSKMNLTAMKTDGKTKNGGFYGELSIKAFDESMFEDVEETGIETIVSRSNDNFDKFFDYA
jgi:hypothetical protein